MATAYNSVYVLRPFGAWATPHLPSVMLFAGR